ncbi:MAG: phosphate ABC transporter substrate-binding protein PstS [Actinobacteria bacterium]|nr:phosphate ABC transporter substrate-binding protein PstS [Actinomycetota bacterium]
MLAALVVLSTSAAIASAAVTGAGSTIASAVMPNWTNGYLVKEGVSVTYSPVGVEAGLAKLGAHTAEFAATDSPLTAEQAAACGGCTQLPWLLTGVDVAYRAKGVGKLDLSGKVLTGIFTGKITKWNDPKIVALNPKAKLPTGTINVVYPGENSGETWTFTNYLSKVSPAWKKTAGTISAVKFPVGTTAKADSGVGAMIGQTEGSIGYVSAPYASAAGLKVAAIENSLGEDIMPSADSFSAAAAGVKALPASGALSITNPPQDGGKGTYPLAMFGYAVVPASTPQKGFVGGFINYAVGPGSTLGEAFGVAPLPKALKSAVRTAVSGF